MLLLKFHPTPPQAKLPVSFTPSEELAAEGRRFRTASADPAAGHPQSRAALDGLSEGEKKLHKILVRSKAVGIVTQRP